MEIELRLVPDGVRFGGFENCAPVVTAVAEGGSPTFAAPAHGIPLALIIGVTAALCVTFYVVYRVNRSNDEEG